MSTKELSRPFQSVVRQFIGTWKGSGEVLPNPWGYNGTTSGQWRFSLALGDKHVLADYREERHDGTAFEGHGLLMQDQEPQDFLWFWFDSYGYPPIPAARGMYDGAALILVKVTPRGKGRTTLSVAGEHLHYEAAFQSPDAADFAIVARGRYARCTPLAAPAAVGVS
jgi:hypothetical protein